MKNPSRLMPKYKPGKLSPLGWIFLASIALAFLSIFYHVPWLLFIIPTILIASLLQNKKYDKNLKQLAESRIGDDIGTFAKHFDCRQIDTWVIRAVYEQFQEYLKNTYPDFPLHPSDNVYKELVADPDDFEMDLVEEIAQRTGRSLESIEKNPYANKVETIRDVVLFFNAQPRITD